MNRNVNGFEPLKVRTFYEFFNQKVKTPEDNELIRRISYICGASAVLASIRSGQSLDAVTLELANLNDELRVLVEMTEAKDE